RSAPSRRSPAAGMALALEHRRGRGNRRGTRSRSRKFRHVARSREDNARKLARASRNRRLLTAAEVYVTILTGLGLGRLLHYGCELNAMEQVIGVMAVIGVIGLLADRILFSPWERVLHRRRGTDSQKL